MLEISQRQEVRVIIIQVTKPKKVKFWNIRLRGVCMSHLEGGNEVTSRSLTSFLHSKLSKLHLPFPKSKAGIVAIGAAVLVITPTAAIAIQNLSTPSNNSTAGTSGSVGATGVITPPASSVTQQSTQTGNSNNTQGGSATTTQVTVNGQQVPVPANGSVQKTITTENGQTTVNVSNTSTSNNNSSSSNVNISSHSYSSNIVNGSHVNNGGN